MVHVVYDINAIGFFPTPPQHGGNQIFQGVRFQRGYGLGYPRQRGDGLGSLLKSVWHYVAPFAKTLGHTLTQEGLASGARILENIAQGAEVKDAVLTEGKKAVRTIAKKAANELRQSGSGGLIGRIRTSRSHTPLRIAGRSARSSTVKRRRRVDSLGFY